MDLPAELERQIFEMVARNDPTSFKSLRLVARRVKLWSVLINLSHRRMRLVSQCNTHVFSRMEPIPYESVVLSDGGWDTPDELVARPADYLKFANHVQRLCITHTAPLRVAERALTACPGITELACWSNDTEHRVLLAPISSLRLRKLSIEFEHFLRLPLEPSGLNISPCHWYRHLTHLELVIWGYDHPPATGSLSFSMLVCLTAVCFTCDIDTADDCASFAEHLFKDCHGLRTVIIAVSEDELDGMTDSPAIVALQERYNVPVIVLLCKEPIPQWSWGGVSVWDEAEEEISRRGLSTTGAVGFLSLPIFL